MAFIARLANALRRANPKNLFCVIEFGDKGPVYVFDSGKGWGLGVKGLDEMKLSRAKFVSVHAGENFDGEERMLLAFDELWARSGKPVHITIITAASPCAKKCAPGIFVKAIRYKGTIKTWTVLYHQPYTPDIESGQFGAVSQKLLNFDDGDLKVQCVPLHPSFVDESTYHGK